MTEHKDPLEPKYVISEKWRLEIAGMLAVMVPVAAGLYIFGHAPLSAAILSPLYGIMGYIGVELYQARQGAGETP